MKNMKQVVLGLFLLTAFVPMQNVALASYSNDEGSHSKKEEAVEGSHPHDHESKADVLMQAAKELKASHPELSDKLNQIAKEFHS